MFEKTGWEKYLGQRRRNKQEEASFALLAI
jgi:hypothetical protein